MIAGNSLPYLHHKLGGWGTGGLAQIEPQALAEYERCLVLPGTIHAICEDYRASASIDLVHDRFDLNQGNSLEHPLLVLWGNQGVIHQCFDPLKEWAKLARNVKGEALPCGHYIAEEVPDLLINRVRSFLD
jgi:haloacetate dehalogenase